MKNNLTVDVLESLGFKYFAAGGCWTNTTLGIVFSDVPTVQAFYDRLNAVAQDSHEKEVKRLQDALKHEMDEAERERERLQEKERDYQEMLRHLVQGLEDPDAMEFHREWFEYHFNRCCIYGFDKKTMSTMAGFLKLGRKLLSPK